MTPADDASVAGPAFPVATKFLAGLLLAAVAFYGRRAADGFFALGREGLPVIGLLAVLGVALGIAWWWILSSRTTVYADRIRQTWWSTKEVRLADITQTKLILLPGLTWIVVPRLVVRTRSPGSVVFHAGDARLAAAFARISLGMPPLP